MKHLDPTIVRREIEALRLYYPEVFEDEQLLHDTLQGQTSLHEFLMLVEERRQDVETMSLAITQRIEELTDRHRRYQKREQAMRRLAFNMMQASEQRTLELPIATLSVRHGTPRVLITNENALEDRFCKLIRTPDKTEIKRCLQAGETVTGATLSNAEPTLAIRTR